MEKLILYLSHGLVSLKVQKIWYERCLRGTQGKEFLPMKSYVSHFNILSSKLLFLCNSRGMTMSYLSCMCVSHNSGLIYGSGHPWIVDDRVAPDKPLDSAVLSRLKQFSAMNKLIMIKGFWLNVYEMKSGMKWSFWFCTNKHKSLLKLSE